MLQPADVTASRDPWWIFTIVNLFWNIKFRYELGFLEIVKVSPRFGILLLCMALSVIFIIVDILAVTPVIPIGVINPFWKFSFVFKCFTDSIILDDFKAALDKLSHHRMTQILPFDLLGDAASVRGFGSSQGEGRQPRKQGRNMDTHSMEIEVISSPTCVELSDGGGIRSPSAAVVHHVENRAFGRE